MEKFSEKEIRFLTDTDFLLTKQEINRKATALLSETEQNLKMVVRQSNFPFPDQAFLKAGKLSRGEQYRGLPYWILDYPRKFSKEATFSFRTMVWWGHEVSCFLHLGGRDLEKFKLKVLENFQGDPDQFVAINPSPWEYHFGPDNYRKASETSPKLLESHISQHKYHKMIYKLSLDRVHDLPEFSADVFAKMLTKLQ